MVNSRISKKQQKDNLADLYSRRNAAAEKNWLKGNKTSMEQGILDAGRQKNEKEKKKA